MRKNCTYCCFILIFISASAVAQDTTLHPSFSISFYADAYLAYYTDSLAINDYQKFPSISPRSEHFGLNVASFSAKYSSDRVRSTITLHYGDVPRSTWSGTFNFIQEANAGLRLCKNFWLDAGFFRTHVGTEGLFPKENITSSVAVPTFFEPYYEAGLRLNYTPCEKLALNLFVLNGYNLFEDNNKKKSLGVLVTYVFNDHLSIGYNNYLGDDTPEEDTSTVHHLRFYNNAFVNFEKGKFKVVFGADVGIQQASRMDIVTHECKFAGMFSGVLALRYMASKSFDIYGRGELFNDTYGMMYNIYFNNGCPSPFFEGLKVWGATFGIEYKPTQNSYVRLEGRDLTAKALTETNSPQKFFYWNNKYTNSRFEALLNFGVWFP